MSQFQRKEMIFAQVRVKGNFEYQKIMKEKKLKMKENMWSKLI